MNKLTLKEREAIFIDLKRTVAVIEGELNFLDKLVREVDQYPEKGTSQQWVAEVRELVKKIDVDILALQRNGLAK